MATGTSAGLLDGPHSQSVHKLSILRQFAPRFLAKTSQLSANRTVALIDGYAGTGRVGDQPGSSARLAEAAMAVSKHVSTLILLCEKDAANYETLSSLERVYAQGPVRVQTYRADIEQMADEFIRQTAGMPTLWFLDPCGRLVPFERVTEIFTHPSRNPLSRRRVPTEALMNISADFIRRNLGDWLARGESAGGVAAVSTMLGGDWWKEVASRHRAGGEQERGRLLIEIVEGYAARLRAQANVETALVPVRRKPAHQPVYYLLFASASKHGIATFLSAAGDAWSDWYAAVSPQGGEEIVLDLWSQVAESETSTSIAKARANEATKLQSDTTEEVKDNIRRILGRTPQGQTLVLEEHAPEVFATAVPTRTLYVSRAFRELERSGELLVHKRHSRDVLRHLVSRGT